MRKIRVGRRKNSMPEEPAASEENVDFRAHMQFRHSLLYIRPLLNAIDTNSPHLPELRIQYTCTTLAEPWLWPFKNSSCPLLRKAKAVCTSKAAGAGTPPIAHRTRHLTYTGVCGRCGGGRGLVLAPAAAAAPGNENGYTGDFIRKKSLTWKKSVSTRYASLSAERARRKTPSSCRVTTPSIAPHPHSTRGKAITPSSDQSTRMAGARGGAAHRFAVDTSATRELQIDRGF